MTTIDIPGHLAGELEVLPNGGVVLLSKKNSRYRVVLARTRRDFVTWLVYTKNGEVSCEAGHYHGGGMDGMTAALADYSQRR